MRDVSCGAIGLCIGLFLGVVLAHPKAERHDDRQPLAAYYEQRAAKDELGRLNKQVEQLVANSDIARAEAIKQKARADALEFFLGTILPGVKPDALIPPPVVPFPTKPVD